MGMYEGGLLMTVLFFTILGFLWVGGSITDKYPDAVNYLGNVPNDANITAYANVNVTQSNFGSGSDSNGINITTDTVNSNPAGSCSITGLLDCVTPLNQIKSFFGVIAKGWILIFEILVGGTPLQALIYLLGIPMQIFQLFFIAQILFLIIGIFTGGRP